MHVGSAVSEVTVTSDIQQLSYTSANLGMVVEEKSMTDLPLVYGNPFALAFLAPGVTMSTVNPNVHTYDSGTSSVSINGSALNSIDYKLDGSADNRIRTTAFTPNTESIAQYRMSTANYDATQGHASGGFVNVQTKSGTSSFHGSLFGYYQNPNVNSNTWSLTPATIQEKPMFLREGLTVGGPVKQQKIFFFYGMEHSTQKTPGVDTLEIPTQREIAGDFSQALALDTTATQAACNTARYMSTSETPNKYQLFDAHSIKYDSTSKKYLRLCIPGNDLATYLGSSFSTVAKKLLAYYPKPTGGDEATGEYSYSVQDKDNYFGEILRLDYTLNDRQSMYMHLLNSERAQQKNQWFGKLGGTDLDYQNYGIALGHTYVLSAAAALDTTLSYTRFTNRNKNSDQGVVKPTTIGMPSYLETGLPDSALALPRITMTNYDALNTASAVRGQDDIWLWNTTLSRQLQNHFVRAGIEYRRYITSGMSGATENGSYTASGKLASQYYGSTLAASGSALSIAELEQGMLSSGSEVQNANFLTRSDYWALYLQDDWRFNKRLTLNLGIRWEHETPMYEMNGKEIVSFNFNANNSTTSTAAAAYAAATKPTVITMPSTINPVGGAIFAKTKGLGMHPYSAQVLNFSPRAGFSYALNDKTVLRGGYGIFFDNLVMYYLSGGNGGSTTTFLVPQQGYSSTSSVVGPTYTNGSSSSAGTLTITSTLADPFSGSLTAPTGNTLGVDTALGQDIQFLQHNPKLTYNQRFSLGVQRQFGKVIVSADYVGNVGRHIPVSQLSTGTNYGGRDYNAIPQSYLSTYTSGLDQQVVSNLSSTTMTNPFYSLYTSGVIKSSSYGLTSSTVALGQMLRPRPEFGRINAFTTDGTSSYNAIQVQAQRRYTTGLSLTSSFTWSHGLDSTVFLNPGDSNPWHGLSANDRPLRFTASAIYQLPWGHGRRWLTGNGILNQLAGGWQVQGVYQVQSGAPLSFTSSYVYYGTDPGKSAWSRGHYKKTRVLGTTAGYWFDPSKWLVSSSSVAGVQTSTCSSYSSTTGANATCTTALPNSTYQIRKFPLRFGTLRADHLNQFDMGLQRQFTVWKSYKLQFRGEAINVLNHPVYSAPSVDPTSSLFGKIEDQANQPRVYQFAAFIRF